MAKPTLRSTTKKGLFISMWSTIRLKGFLAGGVTVAVAFGGVLAWAGSASASVARNEVTTLQYTVVVNSRYQHSYAVIPDPCGGLDFSGTGQYPAAPATPIYTETLSGAIDGPFESGTGLSYTDTYYDPNTGNATGYQYTFTGTFTDAQGDFTGTISDNAGNKNLPTTGALTGASSTSYNHGQFVSQNGPGAAHSCVGMPMQSHG